MFEYTQCWQLSTFKYISPELTDVLAAHVQLPVNRLPPQDSLPRNPRSPVGIRGKGLKFKFTCVPLMSWKKPGGTSWRSLPSRLISDKFMPAPKPVGNAEILL